MKKNIVLIIIKFILGGAPGLVLNYAILKLSSISLRKEGLEMMIVSVIAFALKEILSFTVHKLWTFEVIGEELIITKEKLKKEIASYTISLIAITAANTVSLYFLIKLSNWDAAIAQVVISLVFFIVNFPAIYKVFRKT